MTGLPHKKECFGKHFDLDQVWIVNSSRQGNLPSKVVLSIKERNRIEAHLNEMLHEHVSFRGQNVYV